MLRSGFPFNNLLAPCWQRERRSEKFRLEKTTIISANPQLDVDPVNPVFSTCSMGFKTLQEMTATPDQWLPL
jgi:hypothetical protein